MNFLRTWSVLLKEEWEGLEKMFGDDENEKRLTMVYTFGHPTDSGNGPNSSGEGTVTVGTLSSHSLVERYLRGERDKDNCSLQRRRRCLSVGRWLWRRLWGRRGF